MMEPDSVASARSGATSQEMPLWECFDLLGERHIGRICVVDGGYPLAFPISYQTTRHDTDTQIVFRTAAHTAIARHEGPASLEVDDIDETRGQAWSVIARGALRRVVGAHDLEDPRPFVDAGRHTWTVLHVESMSGRRFSRSSQDSGFAVEWQVSEG